MNHHLIWFRRIALVGVVINAAFFIPALAAPGLWNAMLGLPVEPF